MHILFFADNFFPEVNAAASRVYERAVIWAQQGHSVTILTSQPNFPQGRIYQGYRNKLWAVENISGLRVVRVWTFMAANKGIVLRTLDFLSYMVTAFIAALFEKRPDIVASTSPQFFCAIAAWAYATIRRRPYVFELSDLWPASVSAVGALRPGPLLRFFEKIELFLYRNADAVVALTDDFRRDLTSRGISSDKIVVIKNGVDLSRFSPQPIDLELRRELGLDGKFTIGYFGTHGAAHGLTNVLSAAAILQNDAPEVALLFVGDGAERQILVDEARQRGLPNTHFVGPKPKSAMPRWWSIADAALISLRKSDLFAGVIPSKIFEAMGMGIPLLFVGPAGEASKLILDEGCGVVVPPEEPIALANAIRGLVHSPAMVRLKEASTQAAQRHSRAAQAGKMLEVFRKILDGTVHH